MSCYQGYLSWVDAWMNADPITLPAHGVISEEDAKAITHGEASKQVLYKAVANFHHDPQSRILGTEASMPSSDDTDLLFGSYDPRVDCSCEGLSPTAQTVASQDARSFSEGKCHAIDRLWQAVDTVTARSDEWCGHGLFTTADLRLAAQSLVLLNTDTRPLAKTCFSTTVDEIQAPDRKVSQLVDSSPEEHRARFPTFEQVKLCSDAKYFISIACGISKCDEGLSRAVTDASNDILIGDYAEAADESTLKLMSKSGAAAVAFLKICRMSGTIDGWHLDILAASSIHFRVLSYYRDHARPRLPGGIYGSNMSNLLGHRIIDLGIISPIVIASLATGERIDEDQFRQLYYATVLLNDLIDLRSDAMRKQRENPVLRGMTDDMCGYLSSRMRECIAAVTQMVTDSQLTALVALGFCNWLLMASHHKVYEVIAGVEQVSGVEPCEYGGMEAYNSLLASLESFGTCGDNAPNVRMTRAELEDRYCRCRQSTESHTAWLADAARALLHPHTLRRIIDVGHYRWTGNVGDVEYCP